MSLRPSGLFVPSKQVRSRSHSSLCLLNFIFYSHMLTLPSSVQLVRSYSRKPSPTRNSDKLGTDLGVSEESQSGENENVLDTSNAERDLKTGSPDGPEEANGNSSATQSQASQVSSSGVDSSSTTSSGVLSGNEVTEPVLAPNASLGEASKDAANSTPSAASTASNSTATATQQRPRQRVRVATRTTVPSSKDTEREEASKPEEDLRAGLGVPRLLEPDHPLPPNALMLVTPNVHSLLNIPTHLSIDLATAEHISRLKALAKNQTGVALIYSHLIPLPKSSLAGNSTAQTEDTSASSISSEPAQDATATAASTAEGAIPQNGAYFGMLCSISSVSKHKTLARCELTLLPLHRIKVKPGLLPKSFSTGDIEKWSYEPIDAPDIDDLVVAAMPLMPTPITRPLRPFRTNTMVLEMMLHRICATILEGIGRHDPAGVRQVIERAFVERNFYLKFETIQRALGMTAVAHELSHSIEEVQEKRKLHGLEQQMEKLVRQQLADPNTDPELKLANQIAELPERVRPMAKKEFEYMKTLDPSGQEHGVVSSYLDWLVHIPWNKGTTDRFDMAEAKRILDQSHHGLDDVKIKILQLMANASRTGKMSAKPLLFVGPPGTGKTSFAKAIAEALGRKFISLAGLTETNDVRGHRRTYVGSIPGKIASELRKCGSKNPVIVIDEVDKIEDSQRHRPLTPALLELLSPDQNKNFYDQYLDTTIDCSEVLFICTANSQEAISSPLLNRLQVVELRAYSAAEKFDIAKNYVLPQAQEESGLKNVTMTDDAIRTLVQVYSKYEAGVRQIRRHMQRIMRQLAVRAVSKESIKEATSSAEKEGEALASEVSISSGYDPKQFKFEVTKEEMMKLLEAPEQVRGDRIYDEPPVGVVNGLAKNMYGGSTLTIETIADAHRSMQGKPGVEFTGNIMDTMKESSSIAYTFAKSFLAKHFPTNTFFNTASLHVHVPFALVKKDGPSAGAALVCSYLSVALGQPLPATLCMTGEITLSGRVTAVGGIREKVTAAAQNGMTDVILPIHNKADFDSIPSDLVATIKPHFVSTYDEAFKVAFKLPLKEEKVIDVTPVAASDLREPVVSKRKIVTKTIPEPVKVPTSKPRPNTKITPPAPSNILPGLDEKRRPDAPLSALGFNVNSL